MATELNDSQLEVLKLLNFLKDEKDVAEIKSLLRAYLADKVVRRNQTTEKQTLVDEFYNTDAGITR